MTISVAAIAEGVLVPRLSASFSKHAEYPQRQSRELNLRATMEVSENLGACYLCSKDT
jgi:hypothetical protein